MYRCNTLWPSVAAERLRDGAVPCPPQEGIDPPLPEAATRRLRECYTVGAREFIWRRRSRKPRSRREGDWLIGKGKAIDVYDTARRPAQARAPLDAFGTAVVESGAGDMCLGTGGRWYERRPGPPLGDAVRRRPGQT